MSENERVNSTRDNDRGISVVEVLMRLITASVVLGITAFFTPGFVIANIGTLIVSAVVLTVLDYLLVRITGINASPFSKGVVGFIAAAIIIYATQFFVPGYSVTLWAAIVGAIIYGIVDYFIPGHAM